ncbi:MAG: heme-copper oxidase subunit III [Acidobacteriota bacterium]
MSSRQAAMRHPVRMNMPLPAAGAGKRPAAGGGASQAAGGRLLRFRSGGGEGEVRLPPGTVTMMGVWVALVPILMLFLGLFSAYVVRRGLADDWKAVALPPLLWPNTAVLVISSLTLERARRNIREGGAVSFWLWFSFLLGAAFLWGQVTVWHQMQAAGISLGFSPHGSFFYVLSGSHAVHLILGLLALLAAAAWPSTGLTKISRRTMVRGAAVYWHFLDMVWVGLFLLVFIWR